MPISYKNKVYTTLGTPTALSGNVVSATNSAGVPAKDYIVKGKSIVWNQMVENPDFSNTTVDTRAHVSFRVQQLASPYENFFEQELEEPGLVSGVFTIPVSGNCRIKHNGSQYDIDFYLFDSVKDHKYYICFNFTSTNPTVAGGIAYDKAQLFDLTKMFGAGNEPATVAQFRAMFPDDYYPYNAGELKSIAPTRVEASGVERFQLLDKSKYLATTTIKGVTFTNNGDGTITVNSINITANVYQRIAPSISSKKDHKYCIPSTVSDGGYFYIIVNNEKGVSVTEFSHGIYESPSDNYIFNPYISAYLNSPQSGKTHKPQLFDLTQMFGAGNEPATVAEFWQRVPEKLYGYNPNDYKSANIPSLKYFPDGMRSAGSAYDEINFLSQKAIKRIGAVDMGTLNWAYTNVSQFFYTSLPGAYPFGNNVIPNIICSAYEPRIYGSVAAISASDGGININGKDFQPIPRLSVKDRRYSSAAAFKAAMSGVMLYYELATPIETAISPPLQALSTFKGFTSFSAPNSLTQNGPLSVTYYAEGGANPEKGWLTSYKRKLYMGRNVEWNQLLDKSKFMTPGTQDGITVRNNGDGTFTINGTREEGGDTIWFRFYGRTEESASLTKKLYGHKILYGCVQNPSSGPTNNQWGICYEINNNMTNGAFTRSDLGESSVIATLNKVAASDITSDGFYFYFRPSSSGPAVYKNVVIRPQLFDLTQMFGAGNEPATPEEFWSYFDHKLYPYNPGETQPLFKISRKSRGGGKHYTARWDKVNAKMVRLNDAASFPTDVTNFAYRGSINADYDNPFDSIYPWSGIRICNIDLDAYMALQPGDSITKCVKAWEGDPDFDWDDGNGVWRYRPEFWGKSWDDGTYRYFDVTDKPVGGYVHYPESIGGRWHGRAVSKTINGELTTCLLPLTGIPAVRTPLSTLHTYAKNYGATLDSIYSIDADTLLFVVEYATMNSQSAIGNGVSSLYRQGNYQIAEAATNSTVVKVLASDVLDYLVYGAIFDIGTNNGGNQIGTFYVVSAEADSDPTYLNVTLNAAVTVTTDNYWSVRGLTNQADASIGSKSGYIGTNGKCNAYYRGMVLYGNMLLYTLGIFGNSNDQHYWIATSDEQADEYDALDTSAHLDTGLVLPTTGGYIQTLGMLPRSGLLSIPPFCTAIGGNSTNPIGDMYSSASINSVLLAGGGSSYSQNNGVFYENYSHSAATSNWNMSARPRLKNP